jgi:hypothetical protein
MHDDGQSKLRLDHVGHHQGDGFDASLSDGGEDLGVSLLFSDKSSGDSQALGQEGHSGVVEGLDPGGSSGGSWERPEGRDRFEDRFREPPFERSRLAFGNSNNLNGV